MTDEFWSSDKLTGSQTHRDSALASVLFWSSDKLTGSQTIKGGTLKLGGFGAVTN